MTRIAVVGGTGKLGRMIINTILENDDVKLTYVIGRTGSEYIGKDISSLISTSFKDIPIIDEILEAKNCDVFIDCTNAKNFMSNNFDKYMKMRKPLVISTTGFNIEDIKKIEDLANTIPVFKTGNFSIEFHNFIETIKFIGKKISKDTDISIIEYHHNQKKDAPSGTAEMIQDALIKANTKLTKEDIPIFSIRGGNIVGEHKVVFSNSNDEVIELKHQISSRKAFASGAVSIAKWIKKQPVGLYDMDDYCK